MSTVQRKNAQWDQVIEAFLFAKRAIGIAETTQALYISRLRMFRDFHFEAGLPCQSPLDCNPQCIQRFIVYLTQRNRRLITAFGHYRVLRDFFRWLVGIGLRDDNPMSSVQPPKPETPLPRTVTEDHFQAVMKLLDISKPLDLRYATIFVLLYDTGARLGEILSLRICDVDLKNRLLKIRGKVNKERIVPFGRTAAMLLSKHLSLLAMNKSLNGNDLVFPSLTGTPLIKRNVYRRWWQLQKRAGLKPLPLHGLRHGFARSWLLSGGDAFSLQMILGHAHPETTQRYVTLWASDLQSKHAQHSPVDRLALRIKER